MSGRAGLLAEAKAMAANAYAPYSGLRVGAVVVDQDGVHYAGANVENAAFPSALCAEATAIGTAVSAGARSLVMVAVICLDLPGIQPCGQCRQRLSEFGVEQVITEGDGGEPVVHTLDELLPHRFGPWKPEAT